jgi:hypothetical protein
VEALCSSEVTAYNTAVCSSKTLVTAYKITKYYSLNGGFSLFYYFNQKLWIVWLGMTKCIFPRKCGALVSVIKIVPCVSAWFDDPVTTIGSQLSYFRFHWHINRWIVRWFVHSSDSHQLETCIPWLLNTEVVLWSLSFLTKYAVSLGKSLYSAVFLRL